MVAILLTMPDLIMAQSWHKLRSSNLILEARAYYGWTMAHHLELKIMQKHYPAFEVSLLKATYGRTRWEYMYNYPYIGVSYWYAGLGNVKWMGDAHAVFPYISFPLFKDESFSVSFRLGVGLGYLTKRYERTDNYKNIAIGSHLNGCVNMLLDARWKIGPRFLASAGIALTHFSNGTIKTPNYGLNIPGVSVGMAYRLSRENPYFRKKLLPELIPFEFDGKKYLHADVSLALGIKDMQSTLGVGNMYMVYSGSGNLLIPIGFKSKTGLGLDVSYDASEVKLLELQEVETESNFEVIKTGINAAFELSFSNASMMFNVGGYLSGKEKTKGAIYEKLALRYYLNKNLFTALTLKAHYARADYLTLGIGYRFRMKYY
jgi:hypothetical protein